MGHVCRTHAPKQRTCMFPLKSFGSKTLAKQAWHAMVLSPSANASVQMQHVDGSAIDDMIRMYVFQYKSNMAGCINRVIIKKTIAVPMGNIFFKKTDRRNKSKHEKETSFKRWEL